MFCNFAYPDFGVRIDEVRGITLLKLQDAVHRRLTLHQIRVLMQLLSFLQ